MEEKKVELKLGNTEKEIVRAEKRINPRGRIFEGIVIKKFPKRVVIEFERMVYIRKYERYKRSKTKLHARLPIYMVDEIDVGDLIKVRECLPLSKIIHFVVTDVIKKGEDGGRK